MTKRPEMKPENYEAVYDYYERREPSRANDIMFRLSRQLIRPEVILTDATRQSVLKAISAGKGILAVANHPGTFDPFVDAGAMAATEIPELLHFTALAKYELFLNPVTRKVFETAGSMPVFRRKSFSGEEDTTHLERTKRLQELLASRLKSGRNVALLPEGTRSKLEHREYVPLEAIKRGVSDIALLAGDEHSIILPFGVKYRNDDPLRKLPFRPVVAFGVPIEHYGEDSDAVRHQVHLGIQAALNVAVKRADETK